MFFSSIGKEDKISDQLSRKDFKTSFDYLKYLKENNYTFGKWRLMNINPDVVDALLELKQEIDELKQTIK